MLRRAALVVAACVWLASCVSDDATRDAMQPRAPITSPTTSDARVIALVGSMTGDDMWRGEDAFEGADLAVHILNRSVDEGRPPFQLVTLDDEGDAATATSLVERLAQDERTVGIVYAGPPEGLPPAEPALAAAGIPAILCYGDLYGARLLRPHIFQASPSLLWEARAMARYLLSDRGYRRIAVVAARNLSGDTAVAALRDSLQRTGPHRLTVVRYGDAGPHDYVARLRRRRVEAVVVQGDPAVLTGVARRLEDAGAAFRSRRVASADASFAPQLVGFDAGLSRQATVPRGTVASDTYARGVHYLPIPSFERFRERFRDWWDGDEPLGWEVRAYDAASMIGWAAKRTPAGADIAATLELLDGARFAGLDVTFGPDDHTAVDEQTVGLWVRPRPAFARLVPDGAFPWLPLARGFSLDGERTAILNRDWRFLFRNPPPPDAPAPRIGRMRYAVNSAGSDPIH